jgi:hypothetical protein
VLELVASELPDLVVYLAPGVGLAIVGLVTFIVRSRRKGPRE